MHNISFNTSMYQLPLKAYTSQEWFDREKESIFSNTWQFAGFIESLSNYGDTLCINSGKHHLIVVKDEHENINAFHSICKHRGNHIEETSGKDKKLFRCPYHSWSYDLQGNLIAVPEEQALEAFDPPEVSLRKASVFIWKTLIFIHPEENRKDFIEWLSGIEQYMGPHVPELLDEYPDPNNLYLCHCNWKTFAENYMDGYHLPYLHKNTLMMYDHAKQKQHFVGPHWSFYEPLTEHYRSNLAHYGYTAIDHLDESSLGAYVHLIFPNLGISETESTWSVLRIIPLKPNLTLLETRTKVMPKAAKPSKWFNKQSSRQSPIKVSDYKDPLNSLDFMIEDMYVCENIQKSMDSGCFKAGPMHLTKESSISQFHQAVLDAMML